MCERECASKERDGGREKSGCMFSSFFCLRKFSPPYTFPSNFLESGSIGFGFQFGVIHAFIYLLIKTSTAVYKTGEVNSWMRESCLS